MSNGVNYVELIGNLGHSPSIKRKNDFVVANISLATGSSYKDKETGQKVQQTEWHKVIFFGKLAEIVEKYVKKGDKIRVVGKLKTRKYQDKETGQDRYTTEIIANDMLMLGGAEKNHGEENPEYQKNSFKPPEEENETNAQIPFDDDIPF